MWLKRFTLAAALGVLILIGTAASPEGPVRTTFAVIGALTLVPLFFWLCFVPIMHWRERYKGNHPYVWGAFLVFETSGWSKILYWFMHVLPDNKKSGLYQDEP